MSKKSQLKFAVFAPCPDVYEQEPCRTSTPPRDDSLLRSAYRGLSQNDDIVENLPARARWQLEPTNLDQHDFVEITENSEAN